MNRRTKYLGCLADAGMHLAFAPLLFGAATLYLERLSGNGGLDIFFVINNERFFILHNRFTQMFGQWLPMIGLKTGMNLKSIIIIFSLLAPLTHYVIFLVTRYGLKDRYAAFGIVMVQFFGITYSFFFDPHLEIQYCMALSLLLYAYLDTQIFQSRTYYTLLAVLLLFIIHSYPPAIALVVFVLLLKIKTLERSQIILITALIGVFTITAYLSLDKYETSVLSYSLAGERPANYFTAFGNYVQYFFSHYSFESKFLAILIAYSILRKSYFHAVATLVFIAAYIILILVFYGNNYRLEHINLFVIFFLILLLVHQFRTTGIRIQAAVGIIVGIFILSRAQTILTSTAEPYKKTTAVMKDIFDYNECLSNDLIMWNDARLDSLNVYHGFFQQSLIVSTITRGDGIGILPKFNLPAHLNALQLEFQSDTLDRLLRTNSEELTLKLVNSSFEDYPGINSLFKIESTTFILRNIDERCP